MSYTPFIGMEIHVELATQSKMFCGCPARHFGVAPNTHTCPVCLGLPGALPVPNAKAIEWTRLIGLALGATVNQFSKFDRKHYFYPDLPKGYQISQYDEPLCSGGQLADIRLRRVHLEEDTAKLIHVTNMSLIDFNRSGVPLVEIVTEPDLHSSAQAKEFLKQLQQIIRYLNVSDADMEKGSMRLEANISLKPFLGGGRMDSPDGGALPNYKVEVKNVNSFRFIGLAIDYEIKRQTDLLVEGKTPIQETRGWSERQGSTLSQRAKEQAQDYRYFPEPDIPPLTITPTQIKKLKSRLPELPDTKKSRFIKKYQLSSLQAEILTLSQAKADEFEATVKKHQQLSPLQIANAMINKKAILAKKTVSDPNQLQTWVSQVIKSHPQAVSDFKAGKDSALQFLLGQIMRLSRGQADASAAREILLKLLQ